MIGFWGKLDFSVRESWSREDLWAMSIHHLPNHVTGGMKNTKSCSWKRRGRGPGPWFSHQRVHGSTGTWGSQLGLRPGLRSWSPDCAVDWLWCGSSHQMVRSFSFITVQFFTINRLTGLLWALDVTMRKSVMQMEAISIIIIIITASSFCR